MTLEDAVVNFINDYAPNAQQPRAEFFVRLRGLLEEYGTSALKHGNLPDTEHVMWRIGSKVPLNVYEGNRPVCQCHTPEDAVRIVAAMNDYVMSGYQRSSMTRPDRDGKRKARL
jgi:hypothetical protein